LRRSFAWESAAKKKMKNAVPEGNDVGTKSGRNFKEENGAQPETELIILST